MYRSTAILPSGICLHHKPQNAFLKPGFVEKFLYSAGLKVNAAPFMQNRFPVGSGPSSKT